MNDRIKGRGAGDRGLPEHQVHGFTSFAKFQHRRLRGLSLDKGRIANEGNRIHIPLHTDFRGMETTSTLP
jgi:hypothetical protein